MEHPFGQNDEKENAEAFTSSSEGSKDGSSQDLKQESAEEAPNEDASNWVSGLPLVTILGAISLVCFLMLLDTSIIVTVRERG